MSAVVCAAVALASTLVAADLNFGHPHGLLQIDDPALMPSAKDVVASRAAFDERSHSSAAWEAQLRAASAQEEVRRRAQEEGDSPVPILKYDSTALSGGAEISWPSAMVEPVAAGCTDEVAENTGTAQLCHYTCATLKARLLPNAPLTKTRCFIYDPVSETWPESTAGPNAGEMADLLSMRLQTQDWHTCKSYLARSELTAVKLDVALLAVSQ
jgi:hypothetical protein